MIDSIICGDCLDVMPTLEDKSVNLVILDLPYNIKKASWDSIPEYMTFVGNVFAECERVLTDNGSLYWFHNDFNTIVNVYTWLRDNSRFIFKQFIVWNKRYKSRDKQYNSWMQGFVSETALRTFPRLAEYILKYTFQDGTGLSRIYDNDNCFKPIKVYLRQERIKSGLTNKQFNLLFSEYSNKQGCIDRSVIEHYWQTSQWCMPTKEIYENVLQTTGYFQREYEDLRREYEDLRYTFNNQKTHHSVWNYSVAPQIGHVTPKPVRLIENIIEHSSNEGDTVLDPTAGSGTTAVACKRSDRHYICIEKEPEYCAIAEKRLSEML